MRVLVLLAHPAQRKKSINLAMAHLARRIEGITFVDLYAEYPRFSIDVDREQQRLLNHDVIVFQFPLFWYSTPALLKQWQDLVLEYGFAYGPSGQKLSGKLVLACVTTGGSRHDYSPDGGNEHLFEHFLLPLRQTAILCGMEFLPPFLLHAANHIEAEISRSHVDAYPRLLTALWDGKLDLQTARTHASLSTGDLAHLIGG